MASDASSLLRVAIAQFTSAKQVGATDENLNKIAEFARQAAAAGAQIVVFPELATSGYGIEVTAIKAAVDSQEGVIEVRIETLYPTNSHLIVFSEVEGHCG